MGVEGVVGVVAPLFITLKMEGTALVAVAPGEDTSSISLTRPARRGSLSNAGFSLGGGGRPNPSAAGGNMRVGGGGEASSAGYC